MRKENTKRTVVIILAEELHRQHRAAEKAMKRVAVGRGSLNILLHDHGFYSCGKQKYFVRRAELLIKRAGQKANTLGQAEEALASEILKKRILVKDEISYE